MTDEELNVLPSPAWMPSRIPTRDALVAIVPKGVEFPRERIPSSPEQRWYPQKDGSIRLLVQHDGGAFDTSLFHIAPRAWDHTTCDVCNTRIPAMTVCFVTRYDPYIALCATCFENHVVAHLGTLRIMLWRVKRMIGIHAAA